MHNEKKTEPMPSDYEVINKFLQQDFENTFRDTASALRELGIDIPEVVSLIQADAMFDQVKAEILMLGFVSVHYQRCGTQGRISSSLL